MWYKTGYELLPFQGVLGNSTVQIELLRIFNPLKETEQEAQSD